MGNGQLEIRSLAVVADGRAWSWPSAKRWIFESDMDLQARLLEDGLLKAPIKHFKRFDRVSRLCCMAAVMLDEDWTQAGSAPGMVLFSAQGALDSNRDYFDDYLKAGRQSARGNLFIYTLPTSALAQVSLSFGIKGPLFYAADDQSGGLSGAGRQASYLGRSGLGSEWLLFWQSGDQMAVFRLSAAGQQAGLDFEKILRAGVEIDTPAGLETLNLNDLQG